MPESTWTHAVHDESAHPTTLHHDLRRLFDAAGVQGFLHARSLEDDRQLSFRGDELVVSASTFKVPVLIELFRQADAGTIDLAERTTLPAQDRAEGPTGLSTFSHDVTLSWHDLAVSMMTVSDNAATDAVCEKVGIDKVNHAMTELGASRTFVETDCRGVYATIRKDAGASSMAELTGSLSSLDVTAFRSEVPELTNRTTPADMSRLLELIWTDEAASPASSERMRNIIKAQLWPHRFASGFPEPDITTAGKTGTLLLWRCEAGVAIYPDGRRYVVAVYVRSRRAQPKNYPADTVIGVAARAAVDALRA